METTKSYWGYIGIMEKKMETTKSYWGYIGIMEKKVETTIVCRQAGRCLCTQKTSSQHLGLSKTSSKSAAV